MSTVRIGIIGGGPHGPRSRQRPQPLVVLDSFPVKAELTAICDLVEKQRELVPANPPRKTRHR